MFGSLTLYCIYSILLDILSCILLAQPVYSVRRVLQLLYHVTVCTVLLWRLSLPRCLQEKYLLIYCTRRIKCFLILLSGLLILLVMSISSMWHAAPWGNRAQRLAPTARQTKCVCLCSSASLLCVHRRQSEKEYDCSTSACYLWFVSSFFPYFFKVLRLWIIIIICRVSDF